MKVVAPESFQEGTAGVPYNRSDSRSSPLVCVSASGASLQPLREPRTPEDIARHRKRLNI
jgi:hypothetical protein